MEESKNHIITYANFLLEQATITLVKSQYQRCKMYSSLCERIYNKNQDILPAEYIQNVNFIVEGVKLVNLRATYVGQAFRLIILFVGLLILGKFALDLSWFISIIGATTVITITDYDLKAH